MSTTLNVLSIGPGVAIQDLGRPGAMANGLTRGGAADVLAVHEGAALLRQSHELACLEMVGFGGSFEAQDDMRIALTGAQMKANIDGTAVAWNASHSLPKGSVLNIGGTLSGTYGYLHVGGGIDTAPIMGARATHLSSGFGRLVATGDTLPIGRDGGHGTGDFLPLDKRFDGGTLRVVPSMQTERFSAEMRERFTQTDFRRDPRANRQGVRMDFDGPALEADNQLGIVSEVIVTGDIQIPGDGRPFVLMCESQTTGGYPRMGTVLPADMPRVAQAPVGASLRFDFITLDQARALQTRDIAMRAGLRNKVQPLLRDVHKMNDLLSYQLIDGAISATNAPLDKG
jgi:biotin-dependent carboxylase-like uncharacterized protein